MTYSITRNAPVFSAFDNIWEDFFGTSKNTKESKEAKYVESPKANVYESDTEVGVQLSLPGYDKKNIQVSVKDHVLTVEATKDVKTENLTSQELYATEAKRSFRLGREIEGDSVKAEYVNGVLSLTFQKKAEAAPKKVEIQ